MSKPAKVYRLLGPAGPYASEQKGALGGNRKDKLYGRLDCPAALRAIAKGHYRHKVVFFADEAAAIACGYRPCARCQPAAYAAWKAERVIGKGGNTPTSAGEARGASINRPRAGRSDNDNYL